MPSVRLNEGHVYVGHVRREDAGRTVLAHHVARHPHSDEARWRAHVESGRVLVNGRRVDVDLILCEGDRLEYHRPAWEEPIVDPATVRVLFEDEHVIAVDKPAGLQVLPAGSRLQETLLSVLRGSDPERAEWSPVHRLGRGTSGITLVGKTALARSRLSALFRERRMGKLYLAWVVGEGMPDSWCATQRIGPVEHGRVRIHAVSAAGKPSVTYVRTLRRDAARRAALVAAEPVTGRADQIRIHLAASGCPIAGDPLYGAGGALLDARPGDVGYLLHATSLRFPHPASGRSVRIRCNPPWTPATLDGALFVSLSRRGE
jgi:23S rRNA pseudouridine1911/1915/1917 synthase